MTSLSYGEMLSPCLSRVAGALGECFAAVENSACLIGLLIREPTFGNPVCKYGVSHLSQPRETPECAHEASCRGGQIS